MKWYQKLLMLVSTVALVTVLGCSAWMDGTIPTHIDKAAIEYSDVETKVYIPWWTSLWDARNVQRGLDYQHFLTQTEIARTLEDDAIRYKHLQKAIQINIASAEELRDTLFSPTGPLSILFAAVPALGLGAYLIPRPTDKKRIAELENGKPNRCTT